MFSNYEFDVGAKHSGDKFLLKTSILYPNASPFQGLKTRPRGYDAPMLREEGNRIGLQQ